MSVAPSQGALDGVLAEARAASRTDGATAPAPVASEGPRSNRRGGWRRWWLPALSLGGVCAGVFFLVTPEAALEDQAGTSLASASKSAVTQVNEEPEKKSGAAVPAPSPADEPSAGLAEGAAASAGDDVDVLRSKGYGGLGVTLKDTSGNVDKPVEQASKAALTPGEKSPKEEALKEEEAAEPVTAPAREAPSSKAKTSAESSAAPAPKAPARKRKKSSKRKSAAPSPDAAPEMDLDADPKAAWFEALADAHAQVRSGACSRALDTYGELLRSTQSDQASRRELARIQGGIGVCYERRGQLKLAESAFARARKLDAGIDAWINSLRGSGK